MISYILRQLLLSFDSVATDEISLGQLAIIKTLSLAYILYIRSTYNGYQRRTHFCRRRGKEAKD
jgi:hypothetical protein